MPGPCQLCGRPYEDHSFIERERCNMYIEGDPADVVGHKTFDTGEKCPETGFPQLRHEPLTRAEAGKFFVAADKAQRERTERMPDEQSAIKTMFDAYLRLKEMGWNDPVYCPKDGSHFQVIEPGSTGIHDASYEGEWPKGSWWLYDGDVWPSRPVMFKLYPADQEKHDQKMREGAQRVKAWMAAGCPPDDEATSSLSSNLPPHQRE